MGKGAKAKVRISVKDIGSALTLNFNWLIRTIFCCLWVRLWVRDRSHLAKSPLFSIYICRHKSPMLILTHQVPSSTNLNWPSTTKWQPPGWQKLRKGAKGLWRKVWTRTTILSPNMNAILSRYRDSSRITQFLEYCKQKQNLFGSKTVFQYHYCMA